MNQSQSDNSQNYSQRKESFMQTILDFTKEIVDEAFKYKDQFTFTIMPDKIQIIDYFEDEDWTVVRNLTFLNDSFIVSIDYGDHIINRQFKTIKEAVYFIFN